MCMNTSSNVLETFKLMRIVGRDMFFNQLCIMVSRKVTIRKFKILYTVFTRIDGAAFISFFAIQLRRLFEGGVFYSKITLFSKVIAKYRTT